MRVCPKCGGVATYNSYFGAYLCEKCDWQENIRNQPKKIRISNRRGTISVKKTQLVEIKYIQSK